MLFFTGVLLFHFKVLLQKITSLIEHGFHEEAAELVGTAALDGLRKALLVELTVKKKLGGQTQKPSSPPLPNRPTDKSGLDLDMLNDLDFENSPHYEME